MAYTSERLQREAATRRRRAAAIVALGDPTPGRGACRGCQQLIGNFHRIECSVYQGKLAQVDR